MKRMTCMLLALLMLLSCTAAFADGFTDLFGSFEHIYTKLDAVSNDCEIKPKPSGFTAYGTDGFAFLPVFARTGDVLIPMVVKKGNTLTENWGAHVMIVTDQYTYKLDGKNNSTSSLTIDNLPYSCFLLPQEAMPMFKDIATSTTVTVRCSPESTHAGKPDYLLGADAKALFGAVYEAFMKYDAILDNDLMDTVMNGKAYNAVTYKREANTSSIWD